MPGPRVFCVETFGAVLGAWTATYADTTRRDTARRVLDCWRALADQPQRYPGLPGGLRRAERLVPNPKHTPMPAPTLDEVRAAVRLSLQPANGGRRSVVMPEMLLLCSVVGWRPDQTAALTVGDCSFEGPHPSVYVDRGYKRSTKRYPRRVPVPVWLAEALRYRVEGRDASEPLWGTTAALNPGTVRRLLHRATDAGHVRPETWQGSFTGRGSDRLIGWFRAGVQRYLAEAGARSAAIDVVVGHTSTKDEPMRLPVGRKQVGSSFAAVRRPRLTRMQLLHTVQPADCRMLWRVL